MKKISKILLVLFTTTLFLTSCREQSTADKVEDTVEGVADDVEDAVD